MNQAFLSHRAWTIQTKLCYGFDSCAYITTTKMLDRRCRSRNMQCSAMKNVILDLVKNVKVVVSASYYASDPVIRVYFNISDNQAVDVLFNIVTKNTHNYELVEVKTPRDQEHLDLINNKEITQVIRKQKYYNKYVYSVKIILTDMVRPIYAHTSTVRVRHSERMTRASEMTTWIRDAIPDSKCSVWWDEIQLFTNDISALMMFRLTYDVKSCTIKEAILIENVDDTVIEDKLEIMI